MLAEILFNKKSFIIRSIAQKIKMMAKIYSKDYFFFSK
jgi:hypothetical protein